MQSLNASPSATRVAGLAYATAGFVATHLIFGVLILFLLNWVAWPGIDGTPATGVATAIAIDLALMALFGLQHTGMARAAVKRISAALLPEPLERATYVHFANAALLLLVLAWQPVTAPIWSVEAPLARAAIWLVFIVGWALAAWGSLLIDHLQLLGMRQAWSWFKNEPYAIKPFQRRWLYERMRHPIQLGLILAFWATPEMTVGHLIFAAGLTLYILLGTYFEEKDLIATFADYAAYRRRVPAFIPKVRGRGRSTD
jgi:protein-S-isoprenylcysteine O-methyltransferase Ste14